MEFTTHLRSVDLGGSRRAVEMECLHCGPYTAVYVKGSVLVGTTDTPDMDRPRDIADRFMEEDNGEAPYSHIINDHLVYHLSTEIHHEYGAQFTEYQVSCANCADYSALYEGSVLIGTTDDPLRELSIMIDSYAEEFNLG